MQACGGHAFRTWQRHEVRRGHSAAALVGFAIHAPRDSIPAQSAVSDRRALWALLVGNFVIGTGVLPPAGMMNDLVRELDVSVSKGGSPIWASAIVIGISAPLIAAVTSEVDRRGRRPG